MGVRYGAATIVNSRFSESAVDRAGVESGPDQVSSWKDRGPVLRSDCPANREFGGRGAAFGSFFRRNRIVMRWLRDSFGW